MSFKRIKVRLYPTEKQKIILNRHMDAYRFCYNLCLSYKSTMWKDYKINKSGYDMQKELFQIRKETKWLSICKAECLRDAALNVDKSYKSFFRGKGFPKFKKKSYFQSFTANQSITIHDSSIKFFGSMYKYSTSEKFSSIISSSQAKQITFIKDKIGDYWASCLINYAFDTIKGFENKNIIGVDLGIKDLIVTSDSETFENKRFLINCKFRLRRLQRKFAKTTKGSKNREKLRIKIAKINRRLTNQKEHYYHQITNKLIRENQTIVVEDLNITGMLKNHKLARSISDSSWGILLRQLDYKANWNGNTIIKISRWFPSSKKCSGCGNVKENLSLKERTYDCECCGLTIDRDLNAAINIRNAGLKIPEVPMEDTVNRQANEVGSKSIIFNN